MKTNSLSLKLTALGVLFVLAMNSQNNVILQLDNGSPFRVLLNDKPYADSAQSQLELRDIAQDTLFLKVELEKGERFGVTLYLLDKGKKTKGKEFNYVLNRGKNRLQPVFMGMREINSAMEKD